jgi:hypothetical protein
MSERTMHLAWRRVEGRVGISTQSIGLQRSVKNVFWHIVRSDMVTYRGP